jgi:hypothetical protein
VSVIDTVVVAVDVVLVPVVNGVYATVIVQLAPGLMTNPLVQVPPVIENVPVPAPVLAPSAGFAVSVIGPEVAPPTTAVLLTVIVAGLTVVSAVVIAGVGALKATVPLSTVMLTPAVMAAFPFAVVATVVRV